MTTNQEKIAVLKRTIRQISATVIITEQVHFDLQVLELMITELGGDARNVPGVPTRSFRERLLDNREDEFAQRQVVDPRLAP